MDQVPPGLAARLSGAARPVPARPAATIVLLRPGPGGPEALLLRRPGRSSFAANAWVFPGGAVDEDDGSAAVAERLIGPPVSWWATRLSSPERVALATVAAALREAWEETGIVLADPAVDQDVLGAARAELLAGESRLGDVLRTEGIRLDARDLIYIAHWITPEAEARRYDTRFFLAPAPRDARCELVGEELRESRWIRPSDAVAAFEAGDLRLLPPTVHTLRDLSPYGSVEEITRSLREAPVPTVLPRMRIDTAGVIIEMPAE